MPMWKFVLTGCLAAAGMATITIGQNGMMGVDILAAVLDYFIPLTSFGK